MSLSVEARSGYLASSTPSRAAVSPDTRPFIPLPKSYYVRYPASQLMLLFGAYSGASVVQSIPHLFPRCGCDLCADAQSPVLPRVRSVLFFAIIFLTLNLDLVREQITGVGPVNWWRGWERRVEPVRGVLWNSRKVGKALQKLIENHGRQVEEGFINRRFLCLSAYVSTSELTKLRLRCHLAKHGQDLQTFSPIRIQ